MNAAAITPPARPGADDRARMGAWAAPLTTLCLCLMVLDLGWMAGFFGTYSANVNLATLELDGPTYALVQSAFNRHVRHPLFFALFFGPPLLGALALASTWRERGAWWWLTLAVTLGYALGIVAFTRAVNLPLNHFTESWTPATLPADWAATRDAWNRANLWRAGWNAALFVAAIGALVLRLKAPSPACAVGAVDR